MNRGVAGLRGLTLGVSVALWPLGAAAQETAAPTNPLQGAGELTLVADGFISLEGPQWIPSTGVLLFVDCMPQVIYQLAPAAEVSVFRRMERCPIGLALDPEERLLVAAGGTAASWPRVLRMAADGTTETLAAGSVELPIAPNDLIARDDGNIYFTALRGAPGPSGVLRVTSDGTLSFIWREDVEEGREGPNGIALSPDQRTLYVGYGRGVVRAFDLNEAGEASNERVWVQTAPSADGMCVDTKGNVYVTTRPGVQVFAPNGTVWGTIPVPAPSGPLTQGWNLVTNCAFGGPDARTLYITAQQALYRIELTIPGIY